MINGGEREVLSFVRILNNNRSARSVNMHILVSESGGPFVVLGGMRLRARSAIL